MDGGSARGEDGQEVRHEAKRRETLEVEANDRFLAGVREGVLMSLRERISNVEELISSYVALNAARVKTIGGRVGVAEELLSFSLGIDDVLRREEYIKAVARGLDLDEWTIRERFAWLMHQNFLSVIDAVMEDAQHLLEWLREQPQGVATFEAIYKCTKIRSSARLLRAVKLLIDSGKAKEYTSPRPGGGRPSRLLCVVTSSESARPLDYAAVLRQEESDLNKRIRDGYWGEHNVTPLLVRVTEIRRLRRWLGDAC